MDLLSFVADAQGSSNIGAIMGVVDTGIELTIKAKDVTGFRDERVTLMLMDGRTEEQKNADGGAVGDAATGHGHCPEREGDADR